MKKLTLLKSLVDFVWIVTCIPLIPLVLFVSVYQFFDDSVIDLFSGAALVSDESVWSARLFILLIVALVLVSVYSFYLFRGTLRYYMKRKPFDKKVIKNYNIIGKLLVVSGLGGSVLAFIFDLVFDGKMRISLGLTPYVFLICLGLFFMVLSETFKIAKAAKEENDLTV